MPSNKDIQRAAALAAADGARDRVSTLKAHGASGEALRAAEKAEHAAWSRYRNSS
ncbi:hypothetical protein [Frankia sp. R43]|uniref:hypothetical protein n=1 Tax=Frankia sp. R43 TaxID=269536 RepID=UPI000B055B7D|nr:hypothetical protein [Frankia sp. R43]